jgi:hypothetical protein
MGGPVRVRRGFGVTADLPKHAAELPSSSKLLSNYRRLAGKKKVRAEEGQACCPGQVEPTGGVGRHRRRRRR